MIRDAKLYFVSKKDWRPLMEAAESHPLSSVKNDLAIFEVLPGSNYHYYAVVSVSNEADAVIEGYGGTPGKERDLLIPFLKGGSKKPLFGDQQLVSFLNW